MAFWNKNKEKAGKSNPSKKPNPDTMILDTQPNSDKVIKLEQQYERTSSLVDFVALCKEITDSQFFVLYYLYEADQKTPYDFAKHGDKLDENAHMTGPFVFTDKEGAAWIPVWTNGQLAAQINASGRPMVAAPFYFGQLYQELTENANQAHLAGFLVNMLSETKLSLSRELLATVIEYAEK